MKSIEKFFLTGRNRFIGLFCICLLISSHANLIAQNYISVVETRYPFLTSILYLYCSFNLSGPKDIDELVHFIDISECFYSGTFHYKTVRDITIPRLLNNKDEIRIVSTNCEYTLAIGDTLLFDYDSFPCCDFVEYYYLEEQPMIRKRKVERDLFLFKNKEPIFIIDKLSASLLNDLKLIYMDARVDRERIVFLGFSKNGHLFDYCKTGINLNTSYHKQIEVLLRNFCMEYDIDEIYLHVYCENFE